MELMISQCNHTHNLNFQLLAKYEKEAFNRLILLSGICYHHTDSYQNIFHQYFQGIEWHNNMHNNTVEARQIMRTLELYCEPI